ncbi:MAG: flavin reductase family protein [Marmoricola sp.]
MDALTASLPDLQADFREVMASVCSPVSVVTATAGGRPHGTTVSAFSSLSMDPPMVMLALARTSQLLDVLRSTQRFGLNVLGASQAPLAGVFARKGSATRFDDVAWIDELGLPRLAGSHAFLACRVDDFVVGGDHVIVLGVVEVAAATPSQPLTYHSRQFGTHSHFAGDLIGRNSA